MRDEIKEAFKELPHDGVILDGTLGSCGHADMLLREMNSISLIGIDRDPVSIQEAKEKLLPYGDRVCLCEENFRNIKRALPVCNRGSVDGVLLDLGWRTDQFEGSGKGFSFQKDEPLLMTFGSPDEYPFTARDILNEWSEESIANVLYGYGEERYSRKIAKKVVGVRNESPIESTFDFIEIIKAATPKRYHQGRIHPATRSFQALRIAVNDELAALEECIDSAIDVLNEKGILAIITFHSIEDRIVKQCLREKEKEGYGARINKKTITPSREEIQENPRARSAQLRIFQKTS